MVKRPAGKSRRAPVVTGVIIAPRNSAATKHASLKGVGVVSDGRQRRQVENIFIESAKAVRVRPPQGFRLESGEIFYEGHRVVEVRLAGTIPAAWRKRGSTSEPLHWSTRESPKFHPGPGLTLAMAQQDRGRTYVAVQRSFKVLLVAWDVEGNAERHGSPGPAAGVRFIRITAPADKTEAGSIADNEERYELAIKYAEAITASVAKLKGLITQVRDWTPAAHNLFKAMWSLSQNYRNLFEWRADGGIQDSSKGGRLTIRRLGPRDLERRVLALAIQLAKSSLHVKKGRHPGSKNRKRRARARNKIDERKKKILRAVRAVRKKASRVVGEFKAEDKITKKAVAGELSISRTTFNNWLKEGGLEFEVLVDEVLAASRKK